MSDLTVEERRTKAAEAAARNVPRNPNPLCRDFQAQPEPSAFWCANCRWNRPMHDDEIAREAIAAELDRLPAAASEPDPVCGDANDGDWCELEPGHDGNHRADTAEWATTRPA